MIISPYSFTLEPKLLWRKKILGQIYPISFAKGSGDVIFIHGERRKK
jgi:hypothetical protein